MKHHSLFYLSFLLSASVIAVPTSIDPKLNQIDATEQQHQAQKQT